MNSGLRLAQHRSGWKEPNARLLGVAAGSLAAVGAAVLTQHLWGMLPCPYCILQRILFLAIAAAALLALVARHSLRRVAAGAVVLLAASGAAAALWQHFVAAATASCNLTLADRIIGGLGLDALWPEVFGVWATCADAKVNLLGIPYEFYSLALFVLAAAATVGLMFDRSR